MFFPHQDTGGPIGQWAVGDVGVTCNPAYVCCAPEYVIRVVVKHHLKCYSDVEHVTTDSVQDPLK